MLVLQTEALRKDRAASEEVMQAERAAKYAAEEENTELEKRIESLNVSLSQERYLLLQSTATLRTNNSSERCGGEQQDKAIDMTEQGCKSHLHLKGGRKDVLNGTASL
jgi:hypothetical protein